MDQLDKNDEPAGAMDQLDENDEPASAMDQVDENVEPVSAAELGPSDLRSPVQRRVRRRLVQSTLFPQKAQEREENGDHKFEKSCGDDDDGDDEEFRGSPSKKKKKLKAKATSQRRASKKQLEEKRSVNTTPKKTVTNLKIFEDGSPPIPDLRLEAKMSAEEDSRIFSGKQMHPFFSSWKVGKKNQEVTEVEGGRCSVERRDKGITCGPIHVFETTQEDGASLDWQNWTFVDDTFSDANDGLENKASSVFEGSVGFLHMDKLPIFLHPCDVMILKNEVSFDRHVSQQQHSPDVDHKVDKVGLFSGNTGCGSMEQQSRFLQERMMSYYTSPDNQLEDSLWVHKYRPKKAVEVCGNDEAVKFLSDWLCLWRTRGYDTRKNQTCGDQCEMQDDGYCYSNGVSDSEDIDEEASLKKVLLVTGPVGSGKSAAIYACAQEQGFEVFELSASDCRKGALVKQQFGDVLESHRVERLFEHAVEPLSNHIVKLPLVLPGGKPSEGFENEVVEVIPLSDEKAANDKIGAVGESVYNENGTACDLREVKRLMLFEDVDIMFLEDRGFIAAIQQIAETAKRPIILTSNSGNPSLPDNLDRLQVCFTLPSSEELLCHVYMVCAAEGVNIQPQLLEQLVDSCHGDIRQIIMHLQFWCQGKQFRKDGDLRRTYGSLPFDVEAGHSILPKIIPWEFPSPLSELIEKEITKSLSMMEESSASMDVVEKELGKKEMQEDLDACDNQTESIETKKLAMLKRNGSIEDCNDFAAQFDELSNSSGTPVTLSRQNVGRKHNMVLSSDSEGEDIINGRPIVLEKDANNEASQGYNSGNPSYWPSTENCLSLITDKRLSGAEHLEGTYYECSERPDFRQISERCESVDVSCVPESTFVPETVEGDVTEPLSRTDVSCVPESTFVPESVVGDVTKPLSTTVSCDYAADTLEISMSNESIQTLLAVEADNLGKPMLRLRKTSDMLGKTGDPNPELSCEEELEDFLDQNVDSTTGHQLMDECSRMNFGRGSKFLEKPKPLMVTDLVQASWIKLRGCRTELRQYVVSDKEDAIQSIKLAYSMSDLIAGADLLLSSSQVVGSLEPYTVLSEGSEASSWWEEQIQMASTISQHGFCFYAKAVGSMIAHERSVDLLSEMLASTTNMMALGRLIGQDMKTSRTLCEARGLEMSPPKRVLSKSEINSSLLNIIQSIIPTRSYLTTRDVAFSEYLSSLRGISRSEASRLSQGITKTKRRRRRVARHYLSGGSLMLSPEDISLLGQRNFNGTTSS